MFSSDSDVFISPCTCQSCLVTITEPYNQETGEPLNKKEMVIFALMPHDVDDIHCDFTESSIIHPN